MMLLLPFDPVSGAIVGRPSCCASAYWGCVCDCAYEAAACGPSRRC